MENLVVGKTARKTLKKGQNAHEVAHKNRTKVYTKYAEYRSYLSEGEKEEGELCLRRLYI